MKSGIRKRTAAALAVASTMAALVVGTPGTSWAKPSAVYSGRAFGISGDGTLMAMFTTDRPQVLDWVRTINGLSGDNALVGIDFRPQDGLMYGVGNKGGIYTITTPPTTPDVVVTKVSQLTVALSGTTFDVDFNPAANRLRVISNNGQNLRHNLNDPNGTPAQHTTVADATLTQDGATAHGVTAAAYTNNDLNGTTGTTLFGINTNTDQVVIQSPANNGLLVPTGSLGVNSGLNAGFDIYSDLTGGKTVSNTAFAILPPASGTANPTLYTVDPLTGAATGVGQFPLNITDLAISLDTN
ncbi:DUF4394 domain-containing protein [Streptomyces cavernae]|uniref:DUF4394 domain-containing protein n=1 Tax=Streptomyces cavernae TaxID=2259034 RepID=UPI000FEBA516|nr:DUF4394 domain-containing protein [Streptomyces cavernae]